MARVVLALDGASLPEPLRKEFGLDAEKYVTYYKENLEYLRPVSGEAKCLDAHS